MWRDIILVIGFAVGVMSFFGVTPRTIVGYGAKAKSEVTAKRLYQQVTLFFLIAWSIACIVLLVLAFKRGNLPLEGGMPP